MDDAPPPHDEPAHAPLGRVLGIDLGERRVGVALSSSDRRLALAHSVLSGADRRVLIAAIERIVESEGVRLVVVGVPLELSGRTGAAARRAEEMIEALGAVLAVPVVGTDERLSTVEVTRRRTDVLVARDRARRNGRGGRAATRAGVRRPVLDADAAAVFLQSYLDAGPRRDAPGH